MGIGFLKNKKGQVSIEFILIILILLIYIYSVILPTLNISTDTLQDVTRLSQTKFAAQKLGMAINQLEANKGDGKKTISLFVPEGATVTCDGPGNQISFVVEMSDLGTPPGCQKVGGTVTCQGSIELIQGVGANLTCFGSNPIDAAGGNIFRDVSVTRSSTGMVVEYAS